MTAIVSLLLCLSGDCVERTWQSHDVPALYCATGLWQIDAQRWFGAASLVDQGYSVVRVECEVTG